MQRSTKNNPIVIALLVCIAALAIAAISLIIHVNSLSRQVADAKEATKRAEAKVASYDRSYCQRDFVQITSKKTSKHTIESAGLKRTYKVHTPKEYDPSVRHPVVIGFDGMEGSAARVQSYAGIDKLPVIAVYPEALAGKRGFSAWQGAPYAADGSRDMTFIEDLLADLPYRYCIDATQVFTVGMSNGGGFAYLAACAMSDKIRAVASVSGAYYTDCTEKGQRTPSFMAVHSKADQQVPYQGSEQRRLPEVPRWMSAKATSRHCEGSTQQGFGGAIAFTWYGCQNNSLLRFVSINDQDHGWLTIPSTPKRADTAGHIWAFFQDAIYE